MFRGGGVRVTYLFRDAHYLSVRGAAKKLGWGHMNFHVASRGGGVTFNLDLPAGVGVCHV